MKKHFIGILLVALVISLPIMPLVNWLLGGTAMTMFAKFILPELSIFCYIAFQLYLDQRDKGKSLCERESNRNNL